MDSARAPLRSMIQTAIVADGRDTALVGRHARLELVFAVRRGCTVLTHAYAEPPLRVGRWFADGCAAHMILASSAPGIFGGDEFEHRIHVQRGARVRLTSQSAFQVHPSANGGTGTLQSTYDVADDAMLQCHWDPLIPFAGARLNQRIEIRLAAGAELYWSDAFMGGREGRGERWRFAALAHELRLSRAGAVAYLERYRIIPSKGAVDRRWTAGDACYFGTVVASGRDVDGHQAAALQRDLSGSGDLQAGVDALNQRTLLVRLMASAGVAFHDARALIQRALCA
jgi:urease accessory protein UreH